MNATAVMKGSLALAAACVFLAMSALILLTRRGLVAALQALGMGCFGVMALTHFCEAFSILPSLGWGQPRSVGHVIDLIAALLGVTLMTTSFLLRRRRANVAA
jgi:hypothetical protein